MKEKKKDKELEVENPETDVSKEDEKVVVEGEVVDEEEKVEDINTEDEVTVLLKKIDELKFNYAKAYADTENLKKRLNQEAEKAKKYRIQSFALEILPVIDNLERALKQDVAKEDEGFKKGVEMTYNLLIQALKKEGVEEIDCLNKKFDSNFHQSLMAEKKEGVEPGQVIEVLQKGYTLKDRILRPSLVKVSE